MHFLLLLLNALPFTNYIVYQLYLSYRSYYAYSLRACVLCSELSIKT